MRFDFNRELIDRVKSIEGARWSQSRRFWYITLDNFEMKKVVDNLYGLAYVDSSELKNTSSEKKEIKASQTRTDKKKQIKEIWCDERENTIYLSVPFALKEDFKKLEGAWWHPKQKEWSALDTQENRQLVKEIFATAGVTIEFKTRIKVDKRSIQKPNLNDPVLPDEKFIRHMQLENKAKSTIKQYSWYVKWFLTVNRNKRLKINAGELVKDFLFKEVLSRGYGKTSQNLALSALQNYYRIVYHIDLHTLEIPRPKSKRTLPKVLSEEEFIQLYKQCHNQKHQIILKLMYGCGLRRDEVCNLKTEDVNTERELLFIKGKGGKYRVLNPGKRLITDIKDYKERFTPGEYFIEGQNKGKYSGTSIAKIVERLAGKAGIKRKVTPHMLRHTFATHHMEKGTELRLIQEALGHASSKTTEIYTRVSRKNIKSMRNLLDDLEI